MEPVSACAAEGGIRFLALYGNADGVSERHAGARHASFGVGVVALQRAPPLALAIAGTLSWDLRCRSVGYRVAIASLGGMRCRGFRFARIRSFSGVGVMTIETVARVFVLLGGVLFLDNPPFWGYGGASAEGPPTLMDGRHLEDTLLGCGRHRRFRPRRRRGGLGGHFRRIQRDDAGSLAARRFAASAARCQCRHQRAKRGQQQVLCRSRGGATFPLLRNASLAVGLRLAGGGPAKSHGRRNVRSRRNRRTQSGSARPGTRACAVRSLGTPLRTQR